MPPCSIGPYRLAAEDRPFLLSVLLWIVIFFAALAGLDRSFVKEEESHTAPLLRLAAAPSVVWAGKLLYNLVLIFSCPDGHVGAAVLRPHGF